MAHKDFFPFAAARVVRLGSVNKETVRCNRVGEKLVARFCNRIRVSKYQSMSIKL